MTLGAATFDISPMMCQSVESSLWRQHKLTASNDTLKDHVGVRSQVVMVSIGDI